MLSPSVVKCSRVICILSSYLIAAALILWWLAHHAEKSHGQLQSHLSKGWLLSVLPKKLARISALIGPFCTKEKTQLRSEKIDDLRDN